MTTQAQAAQAIRKELKLAFPNIKFSVKSQSFSMGDSVDIRWIDGPTTKQVDAITKKYQEGSFNAMEDIYEYGKNPLNLPQSKYVMAQRELSDEFKQSELIKFNKYYQVDFTLDTLRTERLFNSWADQIFYQFMNKED